MCKPGLPGTARARGWHPPAGVWAPSPQHPSPQGPGQMEVQAGPGCAVCGVPTLSHFLLPFPHQPNGEHRPPPPGPADSHLGNWQVLRGPLSLRCSRPAGPQQGGDYCTGFSGAPRACTETPRARGLPPPPVTLAPLLVLVRAAGRGSERPSLGTSSASLGFADPRGLQAPCRGARQGWAQPGWHWNPTAGQGPSTHFSRGRTKRLIVSRFLHLARLCSGATPDSVLRVTLGGA